MEQQAADSIVRLFEDAVGKLVIVHWRTRIGIPMTTRCHIRYVEAFQQDGMTWVRVLDDNDMSRVCAPVGDIQAVSVR